MAPVLRLASSDVDLAAHTETFPGVDLIAAGRQVILPPSLHPSGTTYGWMVDAVPARLPGDLVDAFRRTPICRGSFPWVPPGSGYLDAARTGVIERLAAAATPGNRWRALTAAALRYRDLGLTVDDALADLLPAAPIAPDFTEGEARRTVESVWR